MEPGESCVRKNFSGEVVGKLGFWGAKPLEPNLSCCVRGAFLIERMFPADAAFHGDFEPVLAKHSKHFNIIDALSVGVDRMQRAQNLRNRSRCQRTTVSG